MKHTILLGLILNRSENCRKPYVHKKCIFNVKLYIRAKNEIMKYKRGQNSFECALGCDWSEDRSTTPILLRQFYSRNIEGTIDIQGTRRTRQSRYETFATQNKVRNVIDIRD